MQIFKRLIISFHFFTLVRSLSMTFTAITIVITTQMSFKTTYRAALFLKTRTVDYAG